MSLIFLSMKIGQTPLSMALLRYTDDCRYLRTIDVSHDHFGFYLGWGSVALLPTLYTIQVQYLARFPVDLSLPQAVAILSLGLGGYALFRSANHQKDVVRSTNGQCNIWGDRARYIRCSYKTEDGRTHETLLLTSGKSSLCSHNTCKNQTDQTYRLVGSFTSFELSWGLDASFLHVCRLWV